MTLRAEVVTSPSRFEEIGPAWDALWRQTRRDVFQSHDWLSAWRAAQGSERGFRLHVGLCWDGGTLAAAIPCVIRRYRGLPVLEWLAKECNDYSDAIAGPLARPAVECAWNAMSDAGGFHVSYLSHVAPGATIRFLTGETQGGSCALRPNRRSERTLQVRNPGQTGGEWFRGLSKKARNNHTRGKRIIEESGAVSLHVSDRVDGKLDRMIQLKRAWLVATGRRNRLLDDDARTLRHLASSLQRQGVLQVFSLNCDDALVAGLVSILYEDRTAVFFSAFDPRFDRASPGTVVLAEHIMWAFDTGRREIDFLCGDESYKLKFANAQTELAAYSGARTVIGHAALAAESWLDRARTRAAAQTRRPAMGQARPAEDLLAPGGRAIS